MPSVLVTGAARGIGKAMVEHLAASGWDVIAGVRSESDGAAVTGLNPQRISSVILDVTNADHLAALPAALPQRLDAVVNNAGIVVAGPIETLSPEDWRKQLDVNVIGQFAVTRAVLPKLRASRGRAIFISSVNGQLSSPLLGAYAASKFALEAAADALRIEVRPWGVRVAVVEPAQTDTDMWRTADDMVVELETSMSAEYRALYDKHIAGMKKFIPMSKKMAVPTSNVVAVVEEALTARRPRARYLVGLGSKLQVSIMRSIPAALRDRVIARVAGVPRTP
ncbi:SDR family NAD(P)-dependent oxidoreductase [Mycolicibacterium lutetiense]|uniref:NAD(P)-dependent dehydrogenase (Short-subunit alcohol dehydrogenase family) n=1 Tax=Mycolicibacterium lutetiense TaxID=1641992 RepID=A0ABS4ZW43_9MYCO|nr:SDR family NAD(P)-dependent oxidoreductase [Mycolicibacterium lutetiense]MBP2453739.1 NAD(P)-dependent dehydrogenase (short-subunit alcohol dehydrogenase family) [Mycolicibacterium lutetiense]